MLCTILFLFWFKIANEHREFRNYLLYSNKIVVITKREMRGSPRWSVDLQPRRMSSTGNVWTKDEYEQFIQGFVEEEQMCRIIFQMLFWLGCRVGELLALTSGDIDFEGGRCVSPRRITGEIRRIILHRRKRRVPIVRLQFQSFCRRNWKTSWTGSMGWHWRRESFQLRIGQFRRRWNRRGK